MRLVNSNGIIGRSSQPEMVKLAFRRIYICVFAEEVSFSFETRCGFIDKF